MSCNRYYESLRRDKMQYDVTNPFIALQTPNPPMGVSDFVRECATFKGIKHTCNDFSRLMLGPSLVKGLPISLCWRT